MLLKKLYNKVYKVKRKDNGELFAVKYLHKAKILTIEDGQVKIKFGKLMWNWNNRLHCLTNWEY